MIRNTLKLNRTILSVAVFVLGMTSLSTLAADYPDAQEQARRLLSRPLVTEPSQPAPQIEQNAATEEPDAFRQAMILLGHQ